MEPREAGPDPATPIDSRALDDLRYIRRTLESSTAFTAVPGTGGILMGASALCAFALASLPSLQEHWLAVWLADAPVAVIVGGWFLVAKARRSGMKLSHGGGRRFFLALAPALVAGAVLTAVLVGRGHRDVIPGTWLLLFGTGVLTAGASSVAAVPLLGASFMAAGVAAFLAPPSWGHALLGVGFGGLNVGFGIWIRRRHGG
jgi:hypothetical protein